MRQISSFLFGVMAGGALVFFAQRYHVVRTDHGFETIPKLSSGFDETYVDVRDFQAPDWDKHRALAAAIVQAKKEHILNDSASEQTRQGVGYFVDQLKHLRDG
ncbi:MAG TPA: hypothetical protein VGG64_08255 [Pirellulales bacterium]|jgi:hypothetical protein